MTPLDDISFDPGMKYGALILFAEKNEMSTEAKKLKALQSLSKTFSCFKKIKIPDIKEEQYDLRLIQGLKNLM